MRSPAQKAATFSRKWKRTTSFDMLMKYVCPSHEHATTSSIPSPCNTRRSHPRMARPVISFISISKHLGISIEAGLVRFKGQDCKKSHMAGYKSSNSLKQSQLMKNKNCIYYLTFFGRCTKRHSHTPVVLTADRYSDEYIMFSGAPSAARRTWSASLLSRD